jgi:hypothetical protein
MEPLMFRTPGAPCQFVGGGGIGENLRILSLSPVRPAGSRNLAEIQLKRPHFAYGRPARTLHFILNITQQPLHRIF